WRARESLDAIDVSLSEQSLGPYQQEKQRQHVRKPVLDAATGKVELLDENRTEEDLGKFLADADDQAAEDRTGHRCESAEDHDRQRLQGDQRQRKLDAEL